MNSKKTNFFVNILNIIALITIGTLIISNLYIRQGLIIGEYGIKSMFNYGNHIIFCVTNMILVLMVVHAIIAIANIICGIQNRENKKISFWYLTLGISTIWNCFLILDEDYLFSEILISIIFYAVFCAIPIFVILKNISMIKKNKPNILEILSYVISASIVIINIFVSRFVAWNFIAILMIFINNRKIDGEILENKMRKVLNILLYKILYLVGILLFLGLAVSSIVVMKVNKTVLARETENLFAEVSNKNGFKKSEICVPVENDYKYGFINEAGKEIIPCEYDRVSFFYENKINDEKYYYALALKNDKYYLISKENDRIEINDTLSGYLRTVFEYTEITRKDNNNIMGTRVNYISLFETSLMLLNNTDGQDFQRQAWTILKDNSSMIYIDEDDEYEYYEINDKEYKFPSDYSVKYFKDNKMIISIETYDLDTDTYGYKYEIIDLNEDVLFTSECMMVYDNFYLVKNDNNMMVLLDENLNEISDEYDRIYSSIEIDWLYEFSSYGNTN